MWACAAINVNLKVGFLPGPTSVGGREVQHLCAGLVAWTGEGVLSYRFREDTCPPQFAFVAEAKSECEQLATRLGRGSAVSRSSLVKIRFEISPSTNCGDSCRKDNRSAKKMSTQKL